MIHNQENWIVFKGFNTQGIFLIEEVPVIPSAELKQELIEIDGRNGFLTDSQDVYQPIEISVELKLYNKSDIQKARNIFRGSGDLILSNQEDRYYKATVINQIKFERVVRQNHSVVIAFKLQPHAYELKDNTITLTTSPYTLTNETNATSQPEITIYGTGTATLIIGDETVHIKNINNHIILDYELQEAYRITNGSPSNANTDVSCDYGEIQMGTTKIEWSGSGITGIKINPRWRYL